MFKTSNETGASLRTKGLRKRLSALTLAFLFLFSCLPAGAFPMTAEAGTGSSQTKRGYSVITFRDPLPENYRWIDRYAYSVDTDHATITLLRCDAAGKQTVYGCALIDGIPYRIVLAPYCFKDCPQLTGLTFATGSGAAGEPKEAAGMKALAAANMSHQFAGDTGLQALDLSGLDFSPTTDFSYLLEGCSSIVSLTLGTIAPVPNTKEAIVTCEGMFKDCAKVKSINLTKMDTKNVWNMASMFQGCTAASITWGDSFVTDHVTTMAHMFDGAASVKLNFDYRFHTTAVSDISYMFAGTSCALDLSRFSLPNIKSMVGLFKGRTGNEPINLNGAEFDTSRITNMSYVFALGSGAPKITFGSGWTTENVTDFSYMFAGYGRPVNDAEAKNKNRNVSFDTFAQLIDISKGVNFVGMFKNSGFTSINSNKFKKGRLEPTNSLESFFDGSKWLKTVDIGNIQTDKCFSTYRMFADCESLTEITGLNHLSFSETREMSYMFQNCRSMVNFVFGNTSMGRVCYMTGMFDGCSSAKQVLLYCYFVHPGNETINGDDMCGKNDALLKNGCTFIMGNNQQQADSQNNLYRSIKKGLRDEPVTIYPAYSWADDFDHSGRVTQEQAEKQHYPFHMNIVSDLSYLSAYPSVHTEGNSGPVRRSIREALTTTIKCVSSNEATPEIRATWFCPADHRDPFTGSPLTTRGSSDTNYYEIYGYTNDYYTAKYTPTQKQWDDTVAGCMLKRTGTDEYYYYENTVSDPNKQGTALAYYDKNIKGRVVKSNVPDAFETYGFHVWPNERFTVTINKPVYNLTGPSGTTYAINPGNYAIFPLLKEQSFSYGKGLAAEHVLPVLRQKGFTFLGWYDQNGTCVSCSDGTCTPNDSSNQVLTPYFIINETKVCLNTGTPPAGFTVNRTGIRIRSDQKDRWTGSDGNYSACFTVADGLFPLPEAVIPPYSSDNYFAIQDKWYEARDIGESGTKVLPSYYIFDGKKNVQNYTATWGIKEMTLSEKAALQDMPQIQETVSLIDGIDPENPDEEAVQKAVDLYKSLSKEEQDLIPPEEAYALKQAEKIIEQKKALDQANTKISGLEKQIENFESDSKAAQKELAQAKDKAAAQQALAEKNAIDAQKAAADAALQRDAADKAKDEAARAKADAAAANAKADAALQAQAKADASAADARAKSEAAQKAAEEAKQAELVAAAKEEEAVKAAEKAKAAAEEADRQCKAAEQALSETKSALAVAESKQKAAEESEAKKSEALDQVNEQKQQVELQLAATEEERKAAVEKCDQLTTENRRQQEESATKLAASNAEIEKTKQAVSDLEQKLAATNETVKQMTKEAEAAQQEIQSTKEAAAESERKAEEARNDAREARESEEAAKEEASKAREREQTAINDAKEVRDRAEEYRNTRDSQDETEQITKLNEMNASLEAELADSKRMLQELLAKSKAPANPYDTGWSFEPGTATPANQEDTNYDYISSNGGKSGNNSGSSGTSGNAPSGLSVNSSTSGTGKGKSGSTYSYSNGISAGGASAPSNGSSGSAASGKSGSRSSGTYPYSSGVSAGSSASASSEENTSSGDASSTGKYADTDEFLMSWLRDTDYTGGSGLDSSSSENSGENPEYSLADGIQDEDGNDSDGTENQKTEPGKSASALGSGDEGGIDFSSPLATLLSIIGIGAATAAAVAFTWRRKRPVNRTDRRARRPH